MKDIPIKITAFFADEQGGEVAEWALVVGIVVFIGVAAYGANLLTSISGALNNISNNINNASSSG